MNAKFGKREKIVVGSVLGILAIAAYHFFIVQGPARELETRRAERDDLRMRAMAVPKLPPESAIKAYDAETQADEKVFWKAALDMDVLHVPVFSELPAPVAPPTGSTPEVQAKYNQDKADYDKREKAHRRAAEAIVTARLERLMAMKAAYESAKPWPGDAPRSYAEASTGTLAALPATPMQLSFLGDGPTGWNLPLQLPSTLSDKAKLWDEVNHLYNAWDLLNLLDQRSPDYQSNKTIYETRLKAVGMDIDRLERGDRLDYTTLPPQVVQWSVRRLGASLPHFVKVLFARKIWSEKAPEETVSVGLNKRLTLETLRNVFGVEPLHWSMTHLFHAQLGMLEDVLPIARRNGVEDVTKVELPPQKAVYDPPAPGTLGAVGPTDTGTGMPAMPGMGMPGMPGAMPGGPMSREAMRAFLRNRGTGGMSPLGSAGGVAQPDPNAGRTAKAYLAFVNLEFVATNQNAMRFLYDLANQPGFYRIENLSITALPRDEKVKVSVSIEHPMLVIGISTYYDRLVDPNTGAPLVLADQSNIGRTLWEKRLAEEKARGLDIQKIIEDTFKDIDYKPIPVALLGPPVPAAPAAPAAGGPAAGGPPAAAVPAPGGGIGRLPAGDGAPNPAAGGLAPLPGTE